MTGTRSIIERIEKLKELGYLHVALDLEGCRAGSMNEALSGEQA